ncbi:MAG: hypothetical protein HKN89_08230 [Eudoraea sp.]|nr:hypothetical protein [Eudoraea sp.]
MEDKPELFFEDDSLWRAWLHDNHDVYPGVYLIFYKINHPQRSMRWEEAVKVALCYGWIDSTVKSLGEGKRRQYFCPRNAKSTWSALNKSYIKELTADGLIHESGLETIRVAKESGTWSAHDGVENGVIPADLQKAFDATPLAFENYSRFSWTYQKSYLRWLNDAKRKETKDKRIKEIIALCKANKKSR